MARIPMSSCRNRLAIVWLAIAILVLSILLIQGFNDVYKHDGQDDFRQAIQWFAKTISPTLIIMLTALGKNAIKPPEKKSVRVDKSFFSFTLFLSLFFLISVIACFIAQGSGDEGRAYYAVLETAEPWLMATNAIVGVAIGVFFSSGKSDDGKGDQQAPQRPVINHDD